MDPQILHSIPLSAFTIDKHFRLYNTVRARLTAIQFQFNLLSKLKLYNSLSHSISYDPHISFLQDLLRSIKQLDYNSVICNTQYTHCYRLFKTLPKTTKEHCLLIFGNYIPRKSTFDKQEQIMERFVNRLEKKGLATQKQKDALIKLKFDNQLRRTFIKKTRLECLAGRKADVKKRLTYEVIHRTTENWALVFNTLTVDEQHINQVFETNSTHWTDYIRTVDRSVGISIYGSWRKALKARLDGDEFHTYFAVVERGSKTGRLHIHVIHFMRKLPLGSFDPNKGAFQPYYRQLDTFRKFWLWGNSMPIAVRFGQSDHYGQLGWRWPVEKVGKIYIPIPIRSPMGMINYVSEYVSKSIETKQQKGPKTWRIRQSRILGKHPIKQLVKLLPTEKLEQLLIIPSLKRHNLFNRPISSNLIKHLALKECLKRMTPTKFLSYNMELIQLEPKESCFQKLNRVLSTMQTITNPRAGISDRNILKSMVDFDMSEEIKMVEQMYQNIATYFICRGQSEEIYV